MNSITKEQYLKANMDSMIYNTNNRVYFDGVTLKQAIKDKAKKSAENVSRWIPITEQDFYNALNEQFIKMNKDHNEIDKWYNRFKKTYIHMSLAQIIKEDYGNLNYLSIELSLKFNYILRHIWKKVIKIN